MFQCDRGCDGKFVKFGNFVGTKHTLTTFWHCLVRSLEEDGTQVEKLLPLTTMSNKKQFAKLTSKPCASNLKNLMSLLTV